MLPDDFFDVHLKTVCCVFVEVVDSAFSFTHL